MQGSVARSVHVGAAAKRRFGDALT
jgi:hypothetical protein